MKMQNEDFRHLVRQKGRELYRPMPWRDDTRPYYVLVSEIMLQQTQVTRVIPKFEEFVRAFPNETALAYASLADVLRVWQGLGYNRRAKYLHDSAKMIVKEFQGIFPQTYDAITKLPGVGANTAGAIAAYSFNEASVFVETNVRTVLIHHFFNDEFDISDKLIAQKVEQTLDRQHPREFYWSLMDYGSWLKANGTKNISHSKHYKKQPKLKGSVRQVRGQIIRTVSNREYEMSEIKQLLMADERFEPALSGLIRDGLVAVDSNVIRLTK